MSSQISNGFPERMLEPYTSETLTAPTSATALTATKYNPSTHATDGKAQMILLSFLGTAATDTCNFTVDGTTPVIASAGHRLTSGDTALLKGYTLISKLKLIVSAGNVYVTYFK